MSSVTSIAAIVLTCANLEASVKFYSALGLDLRETRHGGPVHFSTTIDRVHFALYAAVDQAPPAAATKLSFNVTELARVLDNVTATGANIIEKATAKPWGLTAVIADPDGRHVELLAQQLELTGPMPR